MATNTTVKEAAKSMRQVAQVAVITCELCNQDKRAIWTCTDCDEAMCNQCKSIHLRSKATRHHNMVAIDVQTDEESTKVIYCKLHKTEPLQMHCIDCDVGLCVDCITETSTHKSHGLIKVQEVIDNMRRELKGFVSKTNERLKSRLHLIQDLQKLKEKYPKDTDACIQNMKIRGENLKTEIDIIIKDFIQEVEFTQTNDLDLLQKKEEQTSKEMKNLEQFSDECKKKLKKLTYEDSDIINELRKEMNRIQAVCSKNVLLEVVHSWKN